MLRLLLVLSIVCAFSMHGRAEEKKQGSPQPNVGTGAADNCVDVEIGSTKTYDCLNKKMQKQTDGVVRPPTLPPVDAQSSDTKKGVVNVPALRQQYGPNYGKSAVPYRPQPPSYAPLRP